MAEPRKYNTNLTENQLDEVFDNALNGFPARFTENENKITANENKIAANETAIGAMGTQVTAVEQQVATVEQQVTTVEQQVATIGADTGWVDCISGATTDGFAFDDTYTQTAKIRKVGSYVSFRASFRVVSNGNDNLVRGFVRNIIPAGFRASEAIVAQLTCFTYVSSTNANYHTFTAQVTTDGAITIFANDGGTIADIYGNTLRFNMDWLIG